MKFQLVRLVDLMVVAYVAVREFSLVGDMGDAGVQKFLGVKLSASVCE